MTQGAALARAKAHIAQLEEALAEYALHYGLTDRARALFREGVTMGNDQVGAEGRELTS